MGLCLGDWENGGQGQRAVAVVHDVLILVRSDRRKDRVEISPEQMAMASGRAEELGEKCGRTVRVIGWYHSHPHITVVPSHVDVRTQAQWQQMDQGFIGLIFGVFNEDSFKTGRVRATAFQAMDVAAPSLTGSTGSSSTHTPNWQRKDVPLNLVTSASCGVQTPVTDTMQRLSELQQILFDEEREAYTQQLQSTGPSSSPMQQIFTSAVYQQALCQLMEFSLFALHSQLTQRISTLTNEKLVALRRENAELKQRAALV
jgi:BRCA1/BRCA2-containing complex subunit 3